MKRRHHFLVMIIAALLWTQASAQDSITFVPRLSISSVPESAFNSFRNRSYSYEEPLASIYGSYAKEIKTCGNITASLDMILSKRIAVTVDFGATVLWKKMYDGRTRLPDGSCRKGAMLHFVPQFKFYYLRRPLVRLYGSVGMGVTKYFGSEFNSSVNPAGQFSPFGIEFGKKFFGFAELGIGTTYSAMRAGVGYIF